jgi:hypothetical protein
MAAYTYKQLLSVAEKIADGFGLSDDMSKKTTGFICQNHNDLLADILAGDLSGVPGVLDEMKNGSGAAGVNTKTEKPEKDRRGASGISDNKRKPGGGRSSVNKQKRKAAEKTSRKAGGVGVNTSGVAVDMITGAAVDCETVEDVPGVLPDNVPGLVQDIIVSFCEQNNIADLSKERQPRWSAACMVVGGSLFKKSKILHDMEREKKNGGIVYDVGRVSALADVWLYLCSVFCKAPMVTDFAFFAGVSDSWLYGVGSPDGLTPARSALLKKLKYAQESGLSSMIVDGRQNPTGALAALNHWHGWTQTREVIHTSAAAASSAGSLPDFGNNSGLLTDSGSGSGGSGS